MTARLPEPAQPAQPAEPAEPAAPAEPNESPEPRWMLRFEMDEPDGVLVVATRLDGETVGMASAGPSRDEDAPAGWELYAINVLAAHHGSGVADQLLVAAVAQGPAMVWVVEDNARAQAFYRRHGFAVEGTSRRHEGTGAPELRMMRRSGHFSHAGR